MGLNISELATAATKTPEIDCKFSLTYLTAGAIPRRQLRRTIEKARDAGMRITFTEERGLIESIYRNFTVQGNARNVHIFVRFLKNLVEG